MAITSLCLHYSLPGLASLLSLARGAGVWSQSEPACIEAVFSMCVPQAWWGLGAPFHMHLEGASPAWLCCYPELAGKEADSHLITNCAPSEANANPAVI